MKSWLHHFIFGNFLVFFWLAVIYFFNFQLSPFEIIIMIALSIFSTLFPDIDLRISKIRNFVAGATAFFIALAYLFLFPQTWFYAIAYFVIIYLIIKLIPTKHRGVTHTVKFSFIFSIGVLIMLNFLLKIDQTENIFWFLVIFSSYNLHLGLDRI